MAHRVYTNKDKAKVLARARKQHQREIALWKDDKGVWHAALGLRNVPNWAVEVEYIR